MPESYEEKIDRLERELAETDLAQQNLIGGVRAAIDRAKAAEARIRELEALLRRCIGFDPQLDEEIRAALPAPPKP